jgi:hypothetical protein
MPKNLGFRDESRTLSCGCKIGRTKGGLWFYDYICEIHLPNVLKNGKYNYEKALKLTEKLNAEMAKEKK